MISEVIMKISGNDRRTGSYYLGLDVGTESVGWAVTSCEYELSFGIAEMPCGASGYLMKLRVRQSAGVIVPQGARRRAAGSALTCSNLFSRKR